MPMKYYLIAGEASGDLHGANLMRSIQKKDPEAEFRFWGGDHMLEISDQIVTHYREVAFMGFVEVIKHLRTILRKLTECKNDIKQYQPDRLILIDYPGFNMKIADWAHHFGIEVAYYISPQIWAWKKNRGHKLKKIVDKMIVILPFEKAVYDEFDVDAHYVGHPLLDALKRFSPDVTFEDLIDQGKKVLAVLPGSRVQEVEKILPVIVNALLNLDESYQILIAATPHISPDVYRRALHRLPIESYQIVINDTYNLLYHADLALVSSGTATLETALFEVPQIVCYKTSFMSYQIGKRIIDLEYISLVNLIMDKPVVTELIQDNLNEHRLIQEIQNLSLKESSEQRAHYRELKQILGGAGASDRAADIILK